MSVRKAGFRGIGGEAVQARMGKGWEEWYAILDACGAREKGHAQSARHLLEGYGLSP